MRKIHRGSSPAEGEPLSAGRVEYLEAARQRARSSVPASFAVKPDRK